MKNCIKILYVMLLALAITSCKNVLEYPDENVEAVDPTLVELEVSLNISIATLLEFQLYDPASKAESGNESYLRTIIELYDNDDLTTPTATQTDHTLYSDTADLSIDFSASLKAKEYTLAVWCDIVEGSEGGDNFFNTGSTLSKITCVDPYMGNSELKSAFSDVVDIDLTTFQDSWYGKYECDVELERPQAMFEIISTDLAKFIAEQDGDSDLSDYTVKVSYDGYLPYGYNVLTEKPNESLQNISYTTNLEILSDSEVRLAFDQIFVNHTETSVSLSLMIYNKGGVAVGEVASQSVTLNRNENNVITGEFLTSDYAPGIGIDPDFDGEFNVVIPD